MNYTDINEALRSLQEQTFALESEYEENGGEITETTEQHEAQIAAIKELLSRDGVDTLGRWLKSKEDEAKQTKAEIDYLQRKKKANEASQEFIKAKIHEVLATLGEEKVKGSLGYSFTATTSKTTEVDKHLVEAIYKERVIGALTAARIPAYITCSLSASATKAEEYGVLEGDEEIFQTSEKPSCRFLKPRASKEEEK